MANSMEEKISSLSKVQKQYFFAVELEEKKSISWQTLIKKNKSTGFFFLSLDKNT